MPEQRPCRLAGLQHPGAGPLFRGVLDRL